MNKKVVSGIIASSLVCAFTTLADDGAVGRLPDGRAFRTDRDGNQLVDYIAELELNIDALKRQVSGLEIESQQKQAIIDKAGTQGGSSIKERDIGAVQPPPRASTEQVAAVKPKVEECKIPTCDCTDQIRDVKAAVVNEERGQSQAAQGELKRQIASLQARLQSESALKENIANNQAKKNSLESVAASLTQETDSLSKRVEDLQARRENLSTQQAALVKVVDEENRSVEMMKAKSQELAKAKSQESTRAQELQQEEPLVRAKLEPVSLEEFHEPIQIPHNAPAIEESPRASMSMTRDSALDSLRGKLSTSLNQIQGLISNRDRLYGEYMKTPRMVAFKPAEARSDRGLNISQLRSEIQDSQTARELSLLMRDVTEIRSKIEFDIGMMERVKRLR